jgi:hypothetical protein
MLMGGCLTGSTTRGVPAIIQRFLAVRIMVNGVDGAMGMLRIYQDLHPD